MNWLPVLADFQGSLNAALSSEDPDERRDRLTRLAQFRLGFVETIQLDKALEKTATKSKRGFRRVRLAVLSSCTIDHLLPAIRIAGLRRGLHIETYAGPYGQYRKEILDPGSALHAIDPKIILISLTCRDVVASVPVAASVDDADHAISDAVTRLRDIWRQASDKFCATIIQQSFLDVTEPLFGNHDRLIPGAPSWIVACLNDRLAQAVAEESVLLLDIARASAQDGIEVWFDVTRWLQGKIEIAPQSAARYGDLVARLVNAQLGQSKKCLVLDLDDTLWGGVIGDDGLEGIVLGEGSAVGEAHLALQRYAKLLNERGIILAVCSKNELATAEAAFRDHPEMILKRSDFAAFVANWTDKAENLRTIAKELNIGLDSLVFVDDSPVERARIRESLPMVAVPELPVDVADYVRCIADAGYFESVSFTDEDLQRSDQYEVNIERERLRDTAQSMDEFLRELEMSVEFGPIASVDLPRATQLVNKTNQFNTTTQRFTREELSSLAEDSRNITLQLRLADRLGDSGLVSVMIICPDDDEPDIFEVVSWVMSCRVFGRQLEDEIMNIAVETALSRGVRAFRADFIPTEKNSVISDLYQRLGFSRLHESGGGGVKSCWRLSLSDYAKRPTYFARKRTKHDRAGNSR